MRPDASDVAREGMQRMGKSWRFLELEQNEWQHFRGSLSKCLLIINMDFFGVVGKIVRDNIPIKFSKYLRTIVQAKAVQPKAVV